LLKPRSRWLGDHLLLHFRAHNQFQVQCLPVADSLLLGVLAIAILFAFPITLLPTQGLPQADYCGPVLARRLGLAPGSTLAITPQLSTVIKFARCFDEGYFQFCQFLTQFSKSILGLSSGFAW
jgi:hypothetical protein